MTPCSFHTPQNVIPATISIAADKPINRVDIRKGLKESRDGGITAYKEWPEGSEEWSVIVTQSGESLRRPSIWLTIVVDVSSSYAILASGL
jgi:hypothetical protein